MRRPGIEPGLGAWKAPVIAIRPSALLWYLDTRGFNTIDHFGVYLCATPGVKTHIHPCGEGYLSLLVGVRGSVCSEIYLLYTPYCQIHSGTSFIAPSLHSGILSETPHRSSISQIGLYEFSGKKPAQNSIEIIRNLHICEVSGTGQFDQFKVRVLS